MGLVAFLILVTSGLGLINPLLIAVVFARVIDPAAGGSDSEKLELLWIVVSLMVVTPIISSALGLWQTYTNNIVGQGVMRDLRNSLYSHLQHMSLRFFTSTRTGEIQSRLSNDVGGVQSVLTDTASTMLANITVVLSTVVAMIFLSWPLTILSLAILPFFLILSKKVGKVRRRVSGETQES